MKEHTMEHPGFESVSRSVSRRQGIPMSRARAIIAAGARKSSAKARRKNPRLNRVKGRTLRMMTH